MSDMSDERMEQLVRDAYDRMTPSREAEDRMLAAILAHADEREAEARPSDTPDLQVVEGGRPVRTRRPWLVALPAAACLLLALSVGTASLRHGCGSSANELTAGSGAVEEAAPEEYDAKSESAAAADAGEAATVTYSDDAEEAYEAETVMAEEAPDSYVPFVSVTLPDGTVLVPVEDAAPLFDCGECGDELGEFVATLENGEEMPCLVWEHADVEGEWLVGLEVENGMWRAVAQEG